MVAVPYRSVALCAAGHVGTVLVAEQNLPKRLVHLVDHAKRLGVALTFLNKQVVLSV
jgi:hypothetical protein